jgi:hypothetical protein
MGVQGAMSEKIKKEEIEQRIVEFLAGIGFIFVMVIAFGLVHFAIFGVVSIVPAPKDKWFVKFALAFPEFSPGYVMSLITYLIGQFVPEFWRTKADTKMLHSQMTKVAGQMGEMTERLERLPDQIPIRVLTSG